VLQRQSLLLLHGGPLGDRFAGSAHALRQLVPDTLELAKIEQARLPGRAVWLLESTHRIGGDERVGQFALKPVDLRADGVSRGALSPLSLVLDTATRGARARHRNLRSATDRPYQHGLLSSFADGVRLPPGCSGQTALAPRDAQAASLARYVALCGRQKLDTCPQRLLHGN
jgi:hypothetical protein